jgi:putative SOS response-associated peptidase YedK
VVLEPAKWDLWLDPTVTDVDTLQPLLVPTIRGTLVRHPVSKDVGNVRNNGPELIEAIALDGDQGQNSL